MFRTAVNYFKSNSWCAPAFFLLYFIWRRAFMFFGDAAGLPQPRVRYLILLAAASAAVTLVPRIARGVRGLIRKYLRLAVDLTTTSSPGSTNDRKPTPAGKPACTRSGVIAKILLAALSVVIGYACSPVGSGGGLSLISDIISMAGATVAVFIFLLLAYYRRGGLGGYIRKVASSFLDYRFIISVVLLNAYAVAYLLTARQPFFWDNAGYWRSAAELSEMAFTAPIELFRQVFESVLSSDYHLLPAVLPAYVMAIFNTGRMAFVLAIVNLYVVPFWAMLYAISKSGFAIGALGLFFVPYFAVVGFLDVGGVICAFACAYLFFHSSDDGFFSGALLCGAMMFRRWYIFYVIAFLVCAMIHSLVIKDRRRKLVLMLFGFIAPSVLFFQGYVSGVLLRENFTDIYSAYSFSITTDIKYVLYYLGLATMLGAVVYTFYAIKKKGGVAAAFPLCCIILIFLLFISVQSFGMQHLLLFAAPLGVICVCASKVKRLKLPAMLVAAACFISVFIPRTQPGSIHEIEGLPLLPSYTVYPQVRSDAEALSSLDVYLRGLDGRTAVLASSFTLNSDLLSLVDSSFHPLKPLRENDSLINLGQVDKRDSLPYSLEYADRIVVADPIQTHLDPGEQRIVTVPAGAILGDTPFSAAFVRSGAEFELGSGVKVYVYERTRPNTAEEMSWLWNEIG